MHTTLISLYRLCLHLTAEKEIYKTGSAASLVVKEFCKQLNEELNHATRFKDKGAQTMAYCMGNLLHPHYRGLLLREYNIYDQLVAKIVSEHPTTERFYEENQMSISLSNEETDLAAELDMMDETEQLWESQNPHNVR